MWKQNIAAVSPLREHGRKGHRGRFARFCLILDVIPLIYF
jgi:hypothetical protein